MKTTGIKDTDLLNISSENPVGGQLESLRAVRRKTKGGVEAMFDPNLAIRKSAMTFSPKGNSYICKELLETEERFNRHCADEERLRSLEQDCERYIDSVRKGVLLRKGEEDGDMPEHIMKERGLAIFEEEIGKLKRLTEGNTPFRKLLFWLSYSWWYYNTDLRSKVVLPNPDHDILAEISMKHLIPALPEGLKPTMERMEMVNVAVGFGHFALLLREKESKTRRIITDTSLYELNDVYGYGYLDITREGKPVTRCVTDLGGGRCFFDGERFMTHRRFETCAPKTVAIDGGYRVNSTHSTIINGMLLDLVDADDKVAQTHGAGPFGCLDFTTLESLESYRLSEAGGATMKVRGNKILSAGKELQPIGYFAPSHTKLLENGFTRYEPSEFHEIERFRFSNVMAVDDRQDFLDAFQGRFKEKIRSLKTLNPRSKKDAVESILRTDPEAALLDMHLTPGEEFEGLWIANELLRRGFKGKIMIISSYGKQRLAAMRELINGQGIHIPGKDLEEIRKCLIGKCRCE